MTMYVHRRPGAQPGRPSNNPKGRPAYLTREEATRRRRERERRAHAKGRQCDICGRSSDTSLCPLHRYALTNRGHPKRTKVLAFHKDTTPVYQVVKQYLKTHPVPPEIQNKFEQDII